MIARAGRRLKISAMFDFTFSPEWGLAGLFLGSFLAATVLPGGSEAALAALVFAYPSQALPALMIATLGNTLGGMTSWWMGRGFTARELPARLHWVQRFGAGVLILSWVPLIGDALCLAAGWLRLAPWPCAMWMALGKAARYAAVIGLTRLF